MEEFDFIQSIKPKYYRQSSVIKGIGDDAAILRHTNNDIIMTMDTMVENIHFNEMTTAPFHIGYRALAANISDIAAMGGKPVSYLVSITVPDRWSAEELQEIYQGMTALANAYHMDLIGGDTVSGEHLSLSITVLGTVNNGKARYRNTAREHDIIFVTGTLGDSAYGLHLLLNEQDDAASQYFIHRHQMPSPRVSFINQARPIERMALNDVSDGIANEANEIAAASDKGMLLDFDRIPYHDLLAKNSPDNLYQWILSGGEDFELIGTVPPEDWDRLMEYAKLTDTKLTSIGKVVDNEKFNGKAWLRYQGQLKILDKSGYTHLKR
ncbi:thiamine-phosphate kinase [Gracilibacillus caseinilyticus]|uniref:Thiamine-monophosphate kinase n=1 Tax=Gracilibacillus caseinilyticus TaxID=2932256 RepID=A0ABY4EXG0_9BACI|nr:thiamine-phosphate kinase [Gracilibacillus caseinilyticus]UOQ49101.1 thiamine-phosphate kinase [Gracilibacillus caseinilyticus]